MRKLFRMRYEKCSGMCYAPSDVMKIHTLGLDVKGTVAFLKRLLAMHAPSCGNDSLGFRLDVEEKMNVFVASFEHYGSLDLFAADTPLGALDQMIDAVLAYYQTEEFAHFNTNEFGDVLVGKDGNPNRYAICEHGTDEKLVSFALSFSGLDEVGQNAVRAEMAR